MSGLPQGGADPRGPDGDAVGDRVWILHAASSMGVTALIPAIILLGGLLCPALLPFPLWAPLAFYPAWVFGAWAVTRWFGRRHFGLPPSARLGEGRMTLLALSVVFILISRDPEMIRIGFWMAAAGLLAGAWADGALLAVVSLRRDIGLLRTLAVVNLPDRPALRAAEREAWSEATGRAP